MRTGEFLAMPGKRQVSIGSSASAVPMPIMIASLCARSRWTRSRTASPVMATGLRARRAGFAVGRDRELEHDVGPAVAHAPDVAGMIAPRLLGADADLDRDARRAQPRVARARDFGIGIFERRDDARNAGGDDGVGAGRRLAVMRAGLERDVERRAARRRAGAAQGFDLGMRPAAGLGPAAADNDAVLDDHRADRRIRPGAAESAPAERQRQAP